MSDDDRERPPLPQDGPPPHAPSSDSPAGPSGPLPAAPRTAAQWREFLRGQEPPDQLADLPRRQRRRARRAWRSARRDQRAQWVKTERRNVPTPISIPLVALLLAALVAGFAWLRPGGDTAVRTETAPTPTPTSTSPAPQPSRTSTPAAPTPALSTPAARPDDVARAFVTGYTTRLPLQDGAHTAAVQRAAPYASRPLTDNLKRHPDVDFDQLVAAQAVEARPDKVTITRPTAKQRPAPDTPVRVYRQATARIQVKGTHTYRYTRHLTLEIARADTGEPWTVTRLLGLKERP
ncbi:hypothetical protein [Streptomyces sp. NPDC001889]